MLRSRVERLPTWAKWVSGFALTGVTGAIIIVAWQAFAPASQPVPTSLPAILLTYEDASTLIERPTVYSAYISTTAPTVDGILTSGEWPEPAFTKTFDYTVEDIKKTGDMNGYFMNDEDFLYTAITFSAEDFKENILEEEVGFWSLNVRFDGDNDGIIATGNDIASFWRSSYSDSHVSDEGDEANDVRLNGFGACQFSPGKKTYTYEFQIPLNSGDSEDLAVNTGDTIGIKVNVIEWQPKLSGKGYSNIGSVGWPEAQGKLDGSTYGRLVLAAKSKASY